MDKNDLIRSIKQLHITTDDLEIDMYVHREQLYIFFHREDEIVKGDVLDKTAIESIFDEHFINSEEIMNWIEAIEQSMNDNNTGTIYLPNGDQIRFIDRRKENQHA
jgi:hypothetical protein